MSKPRRELALCILVVGISLGLTGSLQAATPTLPDATPASLAQPAHVKDIQFHSAPDGAGILTLTFDSAAAQPNLRTLGSTVIVDIDNVMLDAAKPVAINDKTTPLQNVALTPTKTGAQLVLSTQGQFKSAAYQSGSRYVIELAPTIATAKSVGATNTAVATTTTNTAVPSAGSPRPVYRGKPVTFNFQDVPVRTILQLISEESGVNIVASDSVQGNVTLRLINVPWDQALDIVLQAKSLDRRKNGNVIWVAPQSELAKYEQDKEDARIALDNRVDMVTEYIQINYHNAGEIFKALTEAKGIGGGGGKDGEGSGADNGFLSSRGKIVADQRTNTLIISDIPKKIDQMKQLIAVIDRPVDQVLIEARVVVANDTFARELGAKFGVSGYGNGGKLGINSTVGNNVLTQNSIADSRNSGGLTPPTIARGLMSNLGVTNPMGSVALSILNAGLALDVELSAMQREGRGEVVSNPRVVTSNQREAVISQGKEVGFVTLSAASAGAAPTPNVQFKDVLLEMKVNPTITNDGRVFLDMNVKKDEVDGYIDTSIGQVPQISKRAVNTAVLVQDGQTVVIGGVYEFSDLKDVSKVPFLGDVPFLGNLFKKRGSSHQKAELLIMVTPHVLHVTPAAPK